MAQDQIIFVHHGMAPFLNTFHFYPKTFFISSLSISCPIWLLTHHPFPLILFSIYTTRSYFQWYPNTCICLIYPYLKGMILSSWYCTGDCRSNLVFHIVQSPLLHTILVIFLLLSKKKNKKEEEEEEEEIKVKIDNFLISRAYWRRKSILCTKLLIWVVKAPPNLAWYCPLWSTCARDDFPGSHPSRFCSRPSTLNSRVLIGSGTAWLWNASRWVKKRFGL